MTLPMAATDKVFEQVFFQTIGFGTCRNCTAVVAGVCLCLGKGWGWGWGLGWGLGWGWGCVSDIGWR